MVRFVKMGGGGRRYVFRDALNLSICLADNRCLVVKSHMSLIAELRQLSTASAPRACDYLGERRWNFFLAGLVGAHSTSSGPKEISRRLSIECQQGRGSNSCICPDCCCLFGLHANS